MTNADIAAAKQQLRVKMIELRQSLSAQAVNCQSAVLGSLAKEFLRQTITVPTPAADRPVLGLYNAFRNEADFRAFWQDFLDLGFDLAFPVVCDKSMRFIRLPTENNNINTLAVDWFRPGGFGVLEPPASGQNVQPDIMIVPGLAFDRRGFRLGWGRAYYDLFLAQLVSKPLLIGAALDGQLLACVPADKHDQRMDYLLTTKALIKCDSMLE